MAICSKCGAPFKEGEKFCTTCGTNLEAPVAPTQSPVPQPAPVYPPPVATKSKTPLIIGIVVAVIAIVLVIVLVLMFTGGGLSGDESKLVGTWEYESTSILYKFNGDKSLEVGYIGYTAKVGTWSIDGNKLCWDFSSSYTGTDICYDYTLSGNQLTLSYGGVDMMTLTKK